MAGSSRITWKELHNYENIFLVNFTRVLFSNDYNIALWFWFFSESPSGESGEEH